MPAFVQTDWYRFPQYYDIIFDADTAREADFLEAALARYGPARSPARILEPACGSGRLVAELARRGHRVTGFDASREMLAFARERLAREAGAVRQSARLVEARMETFPLRGPFDLVHCLLSTFKHLLTAADARAHLRRVSRALAPGGLLVLGLHLTDYSRRRNEREIWRGERDGISVECETITRAPDRRTRLETLRNRLTVRRRGTRNVERLQTEWSCRTYNARELTELLADVPALEPVACHDFTHDIDVVRALDDEQEDLVLVLRQRHARCSARPAVRRER